MATPEVYNTTTVAEPKPTWFVVPTPTLGKLRCLVKVAEVLLSFVAFILEEVVMSCVSCSAQYFFEFVSCTAFLFTLLLLVILSTRLHTKVGIGCWPHLDFLYTAVLAVLLLIAAIVFAADNSGTSLEQVAVVFGFLSSAAFLLDVFLFWKNNGIPWNKDGTPEANATAPTPHETERLNTGVTAAE